METRGGALAEAWEGGGGRGLGIGQKGERWLRLEREGGGATASLLENILLADKAT